MRSDPKRRAQCLCGLQGVMRRPPATFVVPNRAIRNTGENVEYRNSLSVENLGKHLWKERRQRRRYVPPLPDANRHSRQRVPVAPARCRGLLLCCQDCSEYELKSFVDRDEDEHGTGGGRGESSGSRSSPNFISWRQVDRAQLTPLFRHFLSVKDRFPDAVILYQCGDFFETFFDDAVVLHEKLELALTGKDAGKEVGRVPMAGVPLSSLDRYCAALLEHGYHVAVVEQVEPANGRSGGDGALVRREVTRMLTPGTVLEEGLLDARSNNYLVALWGQLLTSVRGDLDRRSPSKSSRCTADATNWLFGLAYLDVSTGDFGSTAVENDVEDLQAELGRLHPAEVLLTDDISEEVSSCLEGVLERTFTTNGWRASITRRPRAFFDLECARKRIEERFGSQLDSVFDERQLKSIVQIRVIGALLALVNETLERAQAPIAFAMPQTAANATPLEPIVSGNLLTPLQPPRPYQIQGSMMLDGTALRNLEIVHPARDSRSRHGTLLWAMDATVTAMGARLLRRWLLRPSRDLETIRYRQQQVQRWQRDHRQRERLRRLLRGVADIERLAGKVATRRANPRELYALAASLCRLSTLLSEVEARIGAGTGSAEAPCWPAAASSASKDLIKLAHQVVFYAFLTRDKEEGSPSASESAVAGSTLRGREPRGVALSPPPPYGVPVRLPSAAEDRPIFRSGFHAELDLLREQAAGDLAWITAYEAQERERTGIASLRVSYHNVFGYYIQIPSRFTNPSNTSQNGRSQPTALPTNYVRRQTLKSVERYVTPELREREQLILGARARVAALECRLFYDLLEQFGAAIDTIRSMASWVAELDVLLGFAEIALERNYTMPEVVDSSDPVSGRLVDIEDGRHPVVECTLPPNERFVPNSLRIGDGIVDMVLLMGANASGKSVFLRQVALIQIMAQCGSFVPAKRARLALTDRIFTRVGAADDIAAAKSTFVMEMEETATILRHVTPNSLVLLDEVGRGTSTADGLAIARAVTEYLVSEAVRARGIFATHFHELAQLEHAFSNIICFHMAVIERYPTGSVEPAIVFLHRLERGAASRSFGIEVAQQCGLVAAIVQRARELVRDDSSANHEPPKGSGTATEAAQASNVKVQVQRMQPRRWRPRNKPSDLDAGFCAARV